MPSVLSKKLHINFWPSTSLTAGQGIQALRRENSKYHLFCSSVGLNVRQCLRKTFFSFHLAAYGLFFYLKCLYMSSCQEGKLGSGKPIVRQNCLVICLQGCALSCVQIQLLSASVSAFQLCLIYFHSTLRSQ